MVGGDFQGGHDAEEWGEESGAGLLGSEHPGAFVGGVDVGFVYYF